MAFDVPILDTDLAAVRDHSPGKGRLSAKGSQLSGQQLGTLFDSGRSPLNKR
jgi:hypothetical protein